MPTYLPQVHTTFDKLPTLQAHPGGRPFLFVAELEFPELWADGGPWIRIKGYHFVHLRDRDAVTQPGAIDRVRLFTVKNGAVRVAPVNIRY